jgi:hypothetical protein
MSHEIAPRENLTQEIGIRDIARDDPEFADEKLRVEFGVVENLDDRASYDPPEDVHGSFTNREHIEKMNIITNCQLDQSQPGIAADGR